MADNKENLNKLMERINTAFNNLTPEQKDEMKAKLDKYKNMGPTVDEYFNQLKEAREKFPHLFKDAGEREL